MDATAAGPFTVKLSPLETYPPDGAPHRGRMSLDKEFHGDLEATSQGEMLTAMSAVQGSGAYVAVEWVHGTLHGKPGSFALHHTGTMARGTPSLSILVVPDSGNGALTGLTGSLAIDIGPDGAHSYRFSYTLP